MSRAFICLTLEDALAFYRPAVEDYTFNPAATLTNRWHYAIPADWLAADGTLPPARLEVLLCHLYGPSWRQGNDDGSRYVVVRADIAVLDETAWHAAPGGFQVDADGTVTRR